MAFSSPHPSKTRQAVEALLHGSGLTQLAIAERTGVPYGTVKRWNLKTRSRIRIAKFVPDPGRWTVRRMRVVARLFGREGIDPGEVAEALGSRRADASALMRACGAVAYEASGEPPDLATLDAALRTHIGRQIAAFDHRLSSADATVDSAKVLRDLGGLKRLLDDLAAAAGKPDRDGEADGGSPQDLSDLRDRIARRYEAFAAEGTYAGLSGAPGAGGADVAGA